MTKPTEKVADPKPRPTLLLSEMIRLTTCNSQALPSTVEVDGRRLRWVGIGWIDECAADGSETLITDG